MMVKFPSPLILFVFVPALNITIPSFTIPKFSSVVISVAFAVKLFSSFTVILF